MNVEKIAEDYAAQVARDAWAEEVALCGEYSAEAGVIEEPTLDGARERAWEMLHELIDGCAEVTYTRSAWEVVTQDPDAAEEAYRDIGGEVASDIIDRGLSGLVTALAYARLYVEASDRLGLELEKVAGEWEAKYCAVE